MGRDREIWGDLGRYSKAAIALTALSTILVRKVTWLA